MRSALDDGALRENDNLIRIPHRAQPMGDDETGAAPPAEVIVDAGLGYGVEGRRGLVQDEDGRVARERARNLEALALSAAEVASAFFDQRVVLAEAGHDLGVDRGVTQGARDLVFLDGRVPQGHVLPHGALEESDILIDVGEHSGKMARGNFIHRAPVDGDLSGPGMYEARQQPRDGRFSAS